MELVPVAQLGGAKLSGLSYRLDGVTMKGSDLGKGYTAAGIQKRGVSYEQDRDFAAVRRCVERDTAKRYDFARCRQHLRKRGIVCRGIEKNDRLGKHRWVVERTHAWLAGLGKPGIYPHSCASYYQQKIKEESTGRTYRFRGGAI